jgi:hypothetical protein
MLARLLAWLKPRPPALIRNDQPVAVVDQAGPGEDSRDQIMPAFASASSS